MVHFAFTELPYKRIVCIELVRKKKNLQKFSPRSISEIAGSLCLIEKHVKSDLTGKNAA